MTKRAAIYSRVSTDKQTTENQERELRGDSRALGCRLSRLSRETAVSGSEGARRWSPAWDKLLDGIRKAGLPE